MVDGATLERLCGGNSTGGSNPPLSATKDDKVYYIFDLRIDVVQCECWVQGC